MTFDDRGISPDQLGEITKQFVVALTQRSHAEGCAVMDRNIGWHIQQLLDELGDFSCDWTETDLAYPKAYKGLRPIEEQVNLIADQLHLDRAPAMKLLSYGLPGVPRWAEGWAALPILETFDGAYVDHVERALIWHSGVCGNRLGCYSTSRGQEGLRLEEHVRPHFVGGELGKVNSPRRNFAREWGQRVGGQIMIVPVQMGMLRRGQSDRMVKARCLKSGLKEFPLGIFEVACLLAMHPHRVPGGYHEQALNVNTPGDEYTPEGFLKTENCRWKQMGHFWNLDKTGIPYFGFGQDNIRDKKNGPVTASSWDVGTHLGKD